MFTNEELKSLLVLLARTNLTGAEAMVVATLQQKISLLVKSETEAEHTDTPTKK